MNNIFSREKKAIYAWSDYRSAEAIYPMLESLLPPLRRKLHAAQLTSFDAGFSEWWEQARYPGQVTFEHICLYLASTISGLLREHTGLRQSSDLFSANISFAVSREEQVRIMLEASRSMGADENGLQMDSDACSRWFDKDTVIERFRRRITALEQRVAFTVELIGGAASRGLCGAADSQEAERIWGRMQLERTLEPLWEFTGDTRVSTAAMQCLADTLEGSRQKWGDGELFPLSEKTRQIVCTVAMQREKPVWMQVAAVKLLPFCNLESAVMIIRERLKPEPTPGDDLFVRKRTVDLLDTILPRCSELTPLLETVSMDPSDHVRQALVRILPSHDRDLFLQLLQHDPSAQVRGAAVLAMLDSNRWGNLSDDLLFPLCRVLTEEQDPFVSRCAIHVAVSLTERLAEQDCSEQCKRWLEALSGLLGKLHITSEHLAVRRWAAQALEQLWVFDSPERMQQHRKISTLVEALQQKKWHRLPKPFAGYKDLPRHLAVLAQNGLPLALRQTWRGAMICKGVRFVFRWWRTLYEILNPSPDKRQAFRHTVARELAGNNRMPSELMSEVSPTKVPGEPLFIDEEGGWRPYLPLTDDFVSALHPLSSRSVMLHTSEGITQITPPKTFGGRMRAALLLTLRFARYARLRNWQTDSQHHPGEYLKAITSLGFIILFTPHQYEKEIQGNPSVNRFFPIVLPFLDGAMAARALDYFFSVYENTIDDLLLFGGALLFVFLVERVWLQRKAIAARKRTPLTVGGWGTRGKSGTERLKGALFSWLGCSVLSKTTGCEAMVLYAPPFGELRELFLFRPYDKATIWEQHNLLLMADQLGVDLMLWECMGLNPSYVEILQRSWMRDDIATITNTYPDHEDIQGPAGINIPEVMVRFIPVKSHLLTSEEQMLPILEQGAAEVGTTLESVGWLQAGLLPRDLLRRFPYDEHPSNVALTLALAEHLGIPQDLALKEMADRVVPDLGVLKTYPVSELMGRKLQFINGMSANDRFGCLSNWRRTGLHLIHPDEQSGNWVTAVVNNRADRIARSKVFARILVEDISADRYVLIGSNLKGLSGYINQALDEYLEAVSLWQESGQRTVQAAEETLRAAAHRSRVPTSQEQLTARGHAILAGCSADLDSSLPIRLDEITGRIGELLETEGSLAESAKEHFEQNMKQCQQYLDMLETLRKSGLSDHNGLDRRFRELIREWFLERIVVVEEFYTTGEQLVLQLAELTPPGYLNRIMGLQNIKGTGLDFVYRWQAWDQCYRCCIGLMDPDPFKNRPALEELSGFQGFGLLSENYVRNTVRTVRTLQFAQNEEFQAALDSIQSSLESAMQVVRQELHTTKSNALMERIINSVESFLDAGDSIWRRRRAQQIYRDLINERISRQRAAVELQALTLRQKGGWLTKQFQSLKKLLSR